MPAILLLLALILPASAQSDLEFLREEAQVTSASRRAQDLARAPATVYVVTARQIKESGAQTIPEALRGVPGVEVTGSRAMAQDVSIRGFAGPLPNRVLVLVDGRAAVHGYYDFMIWESLPITLDEIDRIEVVEGPVSALYGPNALNGVINIITKRPERVGLADARVTAGERDLLFGTAMHGRVIGPWAYKLDVGWRSADRFENDTVASQAKLVSALVSRDLGSAGAVSVSAGANAHHTQFSAANVAAPVDDGTTGFLRGDWTRGLTKALGYWNYGRTTFRAPTQDAPLSYDTFDGQLEQGFSPADGHDAAAGLEYRRNQAESSIFGPSHEHAQDLWSAFAEDSWRVSDAWTLEADGRLDHHPLTGWHFSPRGAVVFQPRPQHTLRFSAGNAYRNPTLIEDYVDLMQTQGGAQFTRLGRGSTDAERATQGELAYLGQFQRLRARLAVFEYRVDHEIAFAQPQLVSAGPPASFLVPAVNVGGTRGWGGEAQLEAPLGWGLSARGGWSLEWMRDDSEQQASAETAPRHKVSGALTWRRAGWTASSQAFWQSATGYRSNSPTQSFVQSQRVPDYWLLSARLAYAFAGDFEAAVSAWNLTDRRHYELIPAQNGELLGRRIAGTLSWRLP